MASNPNQYFYCHRCNQHHYRHQYHCNHAKHLYHQLSTNKSGWIPVSGKPPLLNRRRHHRHHCSIFDITIEIILVSTNFTVISMANIRAEPAVEIYFVL